MEKITLKPIARELLTKNGEANTNYDVLAYQGTSNQEKGLGSLFVVSHIKYGEEDLAYVVNLISSLAKREYYSTASLQEQDSKNAFERTLKKLNEVLDDFFQNKKFKLNIGLVAIAGESIFISRLGKFKIALARKDDYIDILNNIELFQKDPEGEKEFSNIISGKLFPDDKILAYFPTRSLTSREKTLKTMLVGQTQEEFTQKMTDIGTTANNFSCCGIHISMRQIREIPIESIPSYSLPGKQAPSTGSPRPELGTKAGQATARAGRATVATAKSETPRVRLMGTITDETGQAHAGAGQGRPQLEKESTDTPEPLPEIEQPTIIPAEMSITKRASILGSAVNQFSKFKSLNSLSERNKAKTFIVIAAVVIIPLLVFVTVKTTGNSGKDKNAYNQAEEQLKLAQSKLTQNANKEARTMLQAAISNLADMSGNKIDRARKDINQILNSLDRVSDNQPEFITELGGEKSNIQAKFITANNGPAILAADGKLYATGNIQLGQFRIPPAFLFSDSAVIATFNGKDAIAVYNRNSKKISDYSFKDASQNIDAVLYQSNLYTLSENRIYKYADAATGLPSSGVGQIKRVEWGKDSESGSLIALTVDGNVFTLNTDGKLMKYFKGKKTNEYDLQITPGTGTRLFTDKSLSLIYVADKSIKKIYAFDKNDGTLKTSYRFDSAGTVQDMSVSQDGTMWALADGNKVWRIKP